MIRMCRTGKGEEIDMERLTKRDDNGIYIDCPDDCKGGPACFECERKIAERLAAYEDAMPLERAQELAQAEKAGRLVVLPCKVGDEVFFRLENGEVHKERVQGISMSASCDDTILRFGGYPEAEYAWGGRCGKNHLSDPPGGRGGAWEGGK